MFVCAYWTMLNFLDGLDSLAAVHLLARPRPGVMLTVAIITSFTSVVALSAWVGVMRDL